MAVASTLAYVKELLRQKMAQDENFQKRFLHFFELQVPKEVAYIENLTFLFPIILPPQSYSMEEPFAAELSFTQGGGLWAEENGIVRRIIRLRGNTGWKPRSLKVEFNSPKAVDIANSKQSYSRKLPDTVLSAISGQRHFQYLQDSVFRTYADLKADPATAKDTKLIYHNPQDMEHWVVVPNRFTLQRDRSQPLLYNYDIELFAVERGEDIDADFSEDKSIFDLVKGAMSLVKLGLDLLQGAINDLIALEGVIMGFVKNIDTLIARGVEVGEAVQDYVEGRAELIDATFDYVAAHLTNWETAAGTIAMYMDRNEGDKSVPEEVLQKIRKVADAINLILAHPELFEEPVEAAVRKTREDQEFRRGINSNRQVQALISPAPTSFEAVRERGTELTPGDVQIGEGDILAGSTIPVYRNARQIVLTADDTLPSLAARYLGDARKWQLLAMFNGLKPPYIDTQASPPLARGVGTGSTGIGGASGPLERPFNGVLGIGSKIAIPTNTRSVQDMGILPVLGARTELPAEERALGADFCLEAVPVTVNSSQVKYDIPIDTEMGSTDAKIVRGMANLKQAIVIRLCTEQGTDLLYRRLGVKRLIGLRSTLVDLELCRFRISQAISGDPRIVTVKSVDLVQTDDMLEVDLVAEVRGFSEKQEIHTTIQ